jgi:hypothetical protein
MRTHRYKRTAAVRSSPIGVPVPAEMRPRTATRTQGMSSLAPPPSSRRRPLREAHHLAVAARRDREHGRHGVSAGGGGRQSARADSLVRGGAADRCPREAERETWRSSTQEQVIETAPSPLTSIRSEFPSWESPKMPPSPGLNERITRFTRGCGASPTHATVSGAASSPGENRRVSPGCIVTRCRGPWKVAVPRGRPLLPNAHPEANRHAAAITTMRVRS